MGIFAGMLKGKWLHVRSQAENAATAGSPVVKRPLMLLHTGPGTEVAGQSEAIAIGEWNPALLQTPMVEG